MILELSEMCGRVIFAHTAAFAMGGLKMGGSSSFDLLSEQIPQDEQRVRRTFRQTAHEVGIPLRPERNINAAAPAFFHQAVLQVTADAVEHLKLERRRRDLLLLCELDGCANHALVVR